MRTLASAWTSRVATFLAVALLSFAGVKSAVMQVQMALPQAADCSMGDMAMAGMAMPHGDPTKAAKPAAKGDICAFCADASTAPLIAWAEPLRPPSSTVFAPPPTRPPLGARAPPGVQPRARGPPSRLQTA